MVAGQKLNEQEKSQTTSIRDKLVEVTPGDILKIRVKVIDALSANERALVCQIQFFDGNGAVISADVLGANVSPRFGNYIYIRSISPGDPVLWEDELIHVPPGSDTMRLSLHHWKNSSQLQIGSEIECRDYRKIGKTNKTFTLEPKGVNTGEFEILPFWRAVLSFDILIPAARKHSGADVFVSFATEDGEALAIQPTTAQAIVGSTGTHNRTTLHINPAMGSSEYEGYSRGKACVQLIPPLNADRMRILTRADDIESSILVSQNLWPFETLVEAHLSVESSRLINRANLSSDLRHHSFSKLLDKFPGNAVIYGAALEYFINQDYSEKIISTANQILNRFHAPDVLRQARAALATARLLDPHWIPGTGKVSASSVTGAQAETRPKVAHLAYIENVQDNFGVEHFLVSVLSSQKKAEVALPFVISPGTSALEHDQNTVWISSTCQTIKRYEIGCLSSEEEATVLPTTLLNFSCIVAKKILQVEAPTIIHAHQSHGAYNFALMGLALSKAFRLPLVYDRTVAPDAQVSERGTTTGTFSSRRLEQEYRCMKESHAIVISADSETQWADYGIEREKIFCIPHIAEGKTMTDIERDRYLNEISAIYLKAYEYARRSVQQTESMSETSSGK